MKELSIKEKALRYDEVVERAKIEKEESRNLELLEFIDESFPELKESEDERIRKFLIDYFECIKSTLSDDGMWKGFKIEKILAYIEKKKELHPIEWSEEPVSDDLEEAAKRYATEGDEISDLYIIDEEVEAFKVGARWQKEHLWKPSEEMLEALYRIIPENVMEKSEDEMLLDKLYQGLKYGRVLSNK